LVDKLWAGVVLPWDTQAVAVPTTPRQIERFWNTGGG